MVDEQEGKGVVVHIAEDSPTQAKLLQRVLKSRGYTVAHSKDGQIAYDAIMKEVPAILVSDVEMPNMSGFELCKKIRQSEHLSELPIILLTTLSSPLDIVHAITCSADNFVTKPYKPDFLLSRIKNVLKEDRIKKKDCEESDKINVVLEGKMYGLDPDIAKTIKLLLSVYEDSIQKNEALQTACWELDEAKQKITSLSQQLAKYLSPQIYEAIFSGERTVKIESQHKDLTIFFSDIVSYTPQTEQKSLDELSVWINNYLNTMANIALKHGATIDKFIGDGILAFFGDPKSKGAREDALDCVNMSLEMIEQAKELGIDIRIGVSSGECIVGNFGCGNRMDYTVFGPRVNIASRLESSAETNSIFISQETYDLIKGAYPCRAKGEIQLKGVKDKMKVYRILK